MFSAIDILVLRREFIRGADCLEFAGIYLIGIQVLRLADCKRKSYERYAMASEVAAKRMHFDLVMRGRSCKGVPEQATSLVIE